MTRTANNAALLAGTTKRFLVAFVPFLAVLACFASPAFAGSTPSPWWHLTVMSRPSTLNPGTGKNEVQELKIDATGGEVLWYVESLGKFVAFPRNASAAEAQVALESVYGTENLDVAASCEEAPPPLSECVYTVTFKNALGDRSVPGPDSVLFGDAGLVGGKGLKGEASVVETTKGQTDGTIVLVATNLGDAFIDGETEPVTIADSLPPGLEAIGMEGWSGGKEEIGLGPVNCSIGSVSCTFAGTLGPYQPIEIRVFVRVKQGASSGEQDAATVSGGGAKTASAAQRLAFGGEPTFGVQGYEMMPEEAGGAVDTQAGSHPFQLTTTTNLNQTAEAEPVAAVKDLNFKLPPGLIGNPIPFAQCTIGKFLGPGNECRQETAIGIATVSFKLNGNQVQIDTAPLFNLEPEPGEPARFGFYAAIVPVILDTSVRTGGDYGVTVSVRNISQLAGFLWSQVTFWGVPGDPRHDNVRGSSCLFATDKIQQGATCNPQEEHTPPSLLSMPTSCTGSLQSSVEADSWLRPGALQSFSLTAPMPALDGCNRLPFSSSVGVSPDVEAGSTASGLTVDVHVPQEEALNAGGLAPSDVKDTKVTLPEGVALNPASADGLSACTEAQVALASPEVSACPESSKVGTVEIGVPFLKNPLVGSAYVATQNTNPFGSLVALYVFVEEPISGVRIKLAGEVKPDPVTGQLVSTFLNTPQGPFEDFKLHFFGGSRAPLATPALCGTYTTGASITPWSGNAPTQASSTFNIVSGPNGSACHAPLPFNPSLTAGTTSIQAGGFSPFTMTVSREDGEQNLEVLKLHMPPGLSGLLTGVELCPEAEADAGTCSANSLIGETTVSVGVGGDPYSVRGGRVYITGPYEGAPFGISVVVQAKAGPYNLGQVVVRGKIEVNPTTSALTVSTDASGPYTIPHILDGIPLQIRHVNFTTTRPGFTFNPTDCDPLSVTGSLSSTEGVLSPLSVPFQATNCAVLAFKPGFNVSTRGKTSRASGASLTVKLTYPKAPFGSQANIKSVKVDLPKQLPSRLTTLQKACPAKTFEANPAGCPAESIVGYAKAVTPLIPVPLTGPAYFVSYGGAKFPELVVVLQGYGVTLDLHGETFISKAGITSSTFHTVPDAPVGSFELTLPEGKDSALAANGNLCTSKLAMPTAFTAQNGATIKQSTPIAVTGCAKHKAKKKVKKAGHKTKKGKGK